MKKWVRVCFILLSILLFPVKSYGAPQRHVNMEISYGFQGNVKNGSSIPIKVDIDYTGADTKALLTMRVPVKEDTYTLRSSVWMAQDEMGTGRERIYTYEKEIVLTQEKHFQEIFYPELPVLEGEIEVVLTAGKQVLGTETISCNFSENNFRVLVGVISENPVGIEKLDGMQISIEQGYSMEAFVKVISMKPEEIYPNPDALEQLDVIIADVETPFTEEQTLALECWSNDGGFYLQRKNENLADLFNTLLEGGNKQFFLSYLEKMQYYTIGENDAINQVPITRKPSMVKFLLILLAYVILVGPGLYLFLKKRGKQNYLWASICGLSILFMLIIAVLGRKTNISAPFISYCGVYEQQKDIWRENLEIGIQAPYNSGYTVYLDNAYRLRFMNMGAYGNMETQHKTAEQIRIRKEKERYKINVQNMAAFTQNYMKLKRENRILPEEQVDIVIKGDADCLDVKWKNPTSYTIHDALLVMANRVAYLGTLQAKESGSMEKVSLHSYGNGGMEFFLKEKGKFSDFDFPEYEKQNLATQVWNVIHKNDSFGKNMSYILGIIDEPDKSFQLDSGYKVYGSALFQMAIQVDWEKDGYRWCPNLEIYGQAEQGDFSPMTNLMAQKECTVDYYTGFLGKLSKLHMHTVQYDDLKYYYPFQGTVAFYNWDTMNFEEIHDWNHPMEGEQLERYLSDTGMLRVRYLLEDTLYRTDSSCMLPCLEAAGKVE